MNARTELLFIEQPDIAPMWSVEAEQSVLGGLLLEPGAWERVGDLLTQSSFFDAQHGNIFAAIAALAVATKPADTITVMDALAQRGHAVDLPYLTALSVCVPSAANCRRYAEIVAEYAAQRALIALCDEALTLARERGPVADKRDTIVARFVALERGSQRRAPQEIASMLARALDRYNDLADGVRSAGLPTGIAPLDRLLNGGLRPGKVYGIAARPSVGKSSASRSFLVHQALAGNCVLLLSQEMPADEVVDCVIAELSRIDGDCLQTGQLSDDQWGRLAEGVDRARQMRLHIDDQGGLTLADIRGKARAVKGLQVLALDYLQLCTSTLKGKTTNDEIAEISKGLKALALELQIPIIVLSQLNRKVEERADKEPQLSDLRDSGAIEQDVDVAVMLWTAAEATDRDASRLVGWKVAKHRGGKRGVFAMRWQPATNVWVESYESLKPAKPGNANSCGL